MDQPASVVQCRTHLHSPNRTCTHLKQVPVLDLRLHALLPAQREELCTPKDRGQVFGLAIVGRHSIRACTVNGLLTGRHKECVKYPAANRQGPLHDGGLELIAHGLGRPVQDRRVRQHPVHSKQSCQQ